MNGALHEHDKKVVAFRYKFTLSNGVEKEFTVRLDSDSLSAIPTEKKSYPEWTELKFHLPFATVEETMYRVISMYLLAQYFLSKRGKKPDWGLEKLVNIDEDIQMVNKHFRERLSATKVNDASVNALVNLNCFADLTAFAIEKNRLDEIELLFQAYLK